MADAVTPIAVLLSGRGSNFVAIADAIDRGEIPARIVLVLSNIAGAGGIERARERGLEAVEIPHKGMRRVAHEELVLEALRAAGAEWVCLAGYMRLLSPLLVRAYPRRIVNIHPSLLPAFPGLEAQRQALEWGVRVSGCTVHLVDEELDHGPIVVQRTVDVLPDDDAHRLAARIIVEEHRAYPEALRLLLSDTWRLDGRRIVPKI
ncbi:MAG: phosphoribosylglycinamide formyltransferase [Acidobacteriota bacterium]